jgi:hypothetical protein
MGGAGAPDDLQQGFVTQSWLAVSNDRGAMVTGKYFYHKEQSRHRPEAADLKLQEQFLSACEKLTGIRFE